ncbi:COG4223 family protein [Notoacmeibacter sp. MSK16QG-6]|uniref:COG4223 family protein n=1 Tax=Notoacmeibacter sp. MSK16QG-6 TaxID=2957982 RepID=UPI0020A09B8B|nr:hypothetical protein [Notoacmeibacter sp. MSK16QG-6]MCP1199246.1 hypothetical protein [Notoacmeibacter sp. MSK16QG-6]
MAKKPGDRHSAVNRDPVTIDLDGEDVKRLDESETGSDGAAAEAAEPTPMQPDDVPEPEDDHVTAGSGDGDEDISITESSVEEPSTDVIDEQTGAQEGEQATANEPVLDEVASDSAVADQTAALGETTGTGEADQMRPSDPETAETETKHGRQHAEPVTATAPARSGMGGLTAFLLGALLVALALGTAVGLGYIPLTGEQQAAGPQIERLQQEVDDLKAGLAAQLDTVSQNNAAADDLGALQQEVQQLRETVSSGGAGEEAGLQALSDRVSALETAEIDNQTAAGAQQNAATDETLSNIDQRIASLREELTTLQQNLQSAASDREDAATRLEQSLTEIGDSFENLSGSMTEAQEQIGATSEKVSDLDGRIAQVEQLADANRAQEEVARAIAASALRSAVENGRPFENELQTAQSLGAGGEAVEALATYADSGVKTEAQLAEAVPDVADAMREAASPQPAAASDGGLLEQLRDGARSLVTIRRVGDPKAEGPQSAITRFENAVQAGGLKEGLVEYETLPPDVQQTGDAFVNDLRATIEARDNLPAVIKAVATSRAPTADATSTETSELPTAPGRETSPQDAPSNDAGPAAAADAAPQDEQVEPATTGTEQSR